MVLGEGFLAQGIHIENKAGVEKQQAVALTVNADFVALYKCSIIGYKHALLGHSLRQFYRECDIEGTIDFIFGNAAVVFQACKIISKMPMSNRFTVITAQSRDSPDEYTGISFQNCSIVAATNDLDYNSNNVKSYLGRPQGMYSRTVYVESYVGSFIDPAGWRQWSDDDDQGLDTLYYGEYNNHGPSSSMDDRFTWPGYHIMNSYDAINFTVLEFITGVEWLESGIIPCNL